MSILDSVNDYFDERPFVALIFYLMLLIFFVWHVNRHLNHLQEKTSFDIWTILLLGLTLLGINHIFRTTKDVLKYRKLALDKYKELRKRKKELNDEINKNIQSEQVDQNTLQQKSLEVDQINAEMQYLENQILAEQESSTVENVSQVISEYE